MALTWTILVVPTAVPPANLTTAAGWNVAPPSTETRTMRAPAVAASDGDWAAETVM